LGVALAAALGASIAAHQGDYAAEIEKYRQNREQRMIADDGWLTVVGLFWLDEGDSMFGSDPSNDVVLPKGSAPPRAGRFTFRDGKVTMQLEPGVPATLNEKPAPSAPVAMQPAAPGRRQDTLAMGTMTLFVHQSGQRIGVRIRDTASPYRKTFAGLKWFVVDPQYKATARFIPHAAPRVVAIKTVAGHDETPTSPGVAVFTLTGKEYRLEPTYSEDGKSLFFVFGDVTNGAETYKGGRFLSADLPKDGVVVVDFNRAYNPPCVLSPFTTCRIPLPENRLPIRIEAGERMNAPASSAP
jgi:uncharacterized protein (DUF1684 family)